jgi:hypothetical protein
MPAPTPPRPISLSDEQLSAVMRAAAVLLPADRDPFLRALAHRLRGETELGDGVVYLAIRELMRRGGFFKPPHIEGAQTRLSPAKLQRQRAATPID